MFHPRPIIVIYCILLHLCWAGLVWYSHDAVGATAVNALFKVLGSDAFLSFTLVFASLSATCAMFLRVPWSVLLLTPQQVLLLISAAGAISAMVASQFADGVIRPQAFIIADQIHIVLAAVGHAAAIVAAGLRGE